MNARISIVEGGGFQLNRDIPARGVGGRGPGFSDLLDAWTDVIAPSPWGAHVGLRATHHPRRDATMRRPLYTPEERGRRDSTIWTIVQGVLAPLQFLVFATSLGLVIRYLTTGEGYAIATASILLKTILLYTIMITGCIWEKVVFGKYLFARAFFWEDVFSMLVLALQTAYLTTLVFNIGDARQQMLIAVAAYGVYVINAAQFVLKLRAARLDAARPAVDLDVRLGGAA